MPLAGYPPAFRFRECKSLMVPALENLVEALSRLPSIGRKSAWRLALHLIERPQEELSVLADRIATIRKRVHPCRICFNYSEEDLCSVCSSTTRDRDIICVVEKPTDVLSIERSGRYRGVYHVLGGVLSPINGVTPDRLRIGELVTRVERDRPQEVIIGLGGSGDAETTSLYLGKILSRTGARLSRLARGLPAGMEIEYIDQLTLSQALAERTSFVYGSQPD